MHHQSFAILTGIAIMVGQLLVPEPADAGVYYKITIAGQSGLGTPDALVGMEVDVTINDFGTVAFVGKLQGTVEHVYIHELSFDPGQPIPISTGFLAHNLATGVQVNNAGLVAVRDTDVPSNPDITFVRLWSLATGNNPTEIAEAQSGSGLPFSSVLNNVSVNDNAAAPAVVFKALDQATSQQLLVTHNPNVGCNGATGNCKVPGFTSLRPMIANDGRIVVRYGDSAQSPIQLLGPLVPVGPLQIKGIANTNAKFCRATGLPCTANANCVSPDECVGFIQLGQSPGISDDGSVIAFAAVEAGLFPSVWISFKNPEGIFSHPIQVAGDRVGHFAEIGRADDGKALVLESFRLDERVFVIHTDYPPLGSIEGDCCVVCFIADPSAKSVTNPATIPIPPATTPPAKPLLYSDQEGLWTVRVDFDRDLQQGSTTIRAHATSPIPVIQKGDVIDTPRGKRTITGLELYDPIAFGSTLPPRTLRRGDHRLAFFATTAEGDQLVLRAEHLDSDEDGLLDHWETTGMDIDQDGVVDLRLSEFGSDPLKRDLFLEIDWGMDSQPASWTNEPPPGVTKRAAEVFAGAPALANGIPAGINLHIDAGPGNDKAGDPLSQGMNVDSSKLRGGQKIGRADLHLDVVHFGRDIAPGQAVPGLHMRSIGDVKRQYFFDPRDKGARELAFHYCVFTDFIDAIREKPTKIAFESRITAATGNSISSEQPLTELELDIRVPNNSTLQEQLKRKWVKITKNAGAGQLRRIKSVAGNTITVTPNWTTSPAPGDAQTASRFVLLRGNGGQAEVDFRDAPDFHSIPGNDLIVSKRGFGVSTGGWISNPCETWRTLVHELGHNLGLRHCGTDTDADVCDDPSPIVYNSLMSYRWEQECPDPPPCAPPLSVVQSFASSGGGSVFDDWSNLKLDFQNAAVHLGNSLNRGLVSAGVEAPDPTLPIALDDPTIVDYELVNLNEIDIKGPTILIVEPANAASVSIGHPFSVGGTVSDLAGADEPGCVLSVLVSFDEDGDGNTDDPGEEKEALVTPNGGAIYETSFEPQGSLGPRRIEVKARDHVENPATAIRTVNVAMPVKGTGDFDSNGLIDLSDLVRFQACFSGDGAGIPAGCLPANMDGDSDVDLEDFFLLSEAITGPQ